MNDEMDDSWADKLLTDEEHAEIHHIQHHFDAADEKEQAVLGWRATSIYVSAFRREIVRLQRLSEAFNSSHTAANCRCGHPESSHTAVVVCTLCSSSGEQEVGLTGIEM